MGALPMMPDLRPCLWCAVALLVSGDALTAQDRPTRRWLAAPRLEATIDGTPGRELNDPQVLLGTRDGNAVVFDYGDLELRAFSPTGKALWTFGRKGAGPGEFQAASDLELTDNGDIAVFDQELQRLTVVTAAGRLRSTTVLVERGYSLVPLAGGAAFGATATDRELLWRWVHPQGNARTEPLPPEVTVEHALSRETYIAGAGSSGAVAAFRWSDLLLLLDREGRTRKTVRGPEVIPFATPISVPVKIPGTISAVATRMSPGAPEATVEVAATSTRAYVLFSGSTSDRRKLVDVYDITAGRYIGSLRLTERAFAIAALPNNRLATLHSSPLPHVSIWRLPTAGATSAGE
jgi:hypothetical protein